MSCRVVKYLAVDEFGDDSLLLACHVEWLNIWLWMNLVMTVYFLMTGTVWYHSWMDFVCRGFIDVYNLQLTSKTKNN